MELVTVAEFDNSTKGHFAKMQLEMGEVESFLIDLEAVSMDWALGRAIGLIKLQVREVDLEKAAEILGSLVGGELDEETMERSKRTVRRITWVIGGIVAAIFAIAFMQIDSL